MFVDLRSDTVTRPTEAMRSAMAAAEVGDDVYGEDPTLNMLEAEIASLFGHEAAMFVPSGTMGNQISVQLQVPRGSELLLENDAHIVTYESAAAAVIGGIQTRTLLAPRGLLDPEAVAAQIRPPAFHTVATSAVAVEQTHNRGGGSVYPIEQLRAIRDVCLSAGVGLHCDGARIWNAHVATGVPLTEYGALFDTMSVCLSKGLGAPVGSVVIMADAALVETARALRRRLGGGMRQAGVLAAAGIHALDHHLGRLADDHRRARQLAEAIAASAPGVVRPDEVETNIVQLDLSRTGTDAAAVAAACRA